MRNPEYYEIYKKGVESERQRVLKLLKKHHKHIKTLELKGGWHWLVPREVFEKMCQFKIEDK